MYLIVQDESTLKLRACVVLELKNGLEKTRDINVHSAELIQMCVCVFVCLVGTLACDLLIT